MISQKNWHYVTFTKVIMELTVVSVLYLYPRISKEKMRDASQKSCQISTLDHLLLSHHT